MFSSSKFFFFFQAEDGIRDPLVTGVQTCALPICARSGRPRPAPSPPPPARASPPRGWGPPRRSEERRVGKESRSRRWWYHESKKSTRADHAKHPDPAHTTQTQHFITRRDAPAPDK